MSDVEMIPETDPVAPDPAPELVRRHVVDGDGRIVNTITVDARRPPEGLTLVDADAVGGTIGDTWDADAGVVVPAPIPPEPVPAEVTARQARLALHRAGLLTDAEAALAAMDGPEGAEARLEWEYATALERRHPMVVALCAALGLTEAEADDLFRAAAAI